MTAPGHGLVWLASYPKSGNTWLRLALARAFLGADFKPDRVDRVAPIFASPHFFDGLFTPIPNGDPTEIAPHWIPAQERFVAAQAKNQFLKTHNILRVGKTIAYTSAATTLAHIYVIRDPRDVLESYTNHFNVDHQTALAQMLDPNHFIRNPRTHFSEILGSWPAHVMSWSHFTQRPRLVLRYEDMKAAPEQTFAKAFRFLGLNVSSAALTAILDDVQFSKMQAAEEHDGFREAVRGRAFFRRGESGGWRALDYDALIRPLEQYCAPVMRAYGYTPELDRPTRVAAGG